MAEINEFDLSQYDLQQLIDAAKIKEEKPSCPLSGEKNIDEIEFYYGPYADENKDSDDDDDDSEFDIDNFYTASNKDRDHNNLMPLPDYLDIYNNDNNNGSDNMPSNSHDDIIQKMDELEIKIDDMNDTLQSMEKKLKHIPKMLRLMKELNNKFDMIMGIQPKSNVSEIEDMMNLGGFT